MNTITTQQLHALPDDPNVWVINNTASFMPSASDVLLQVPLQGDERTTITVPASWLPLNLSDFATKRYVLASTSFLAAVSSGNPFNQPLLRIIDNETAAQILARPEAGSERARLAAARSEVAAAARKTDYNKDMVVSSTTDDGVTGDDLNRRGIEVVHRSGNKAAQLRNSMRDHLASFPNDAGGQGLNFADIDGTGDDSFDQFISELLELNEADALARLKQHGTLTHEQGLKLFQQLPAARYPRLCRFLHQRTAA